jgi:hypothetical protein
MVHFVRFAALTIISCCLFCLLQTIPICGKWLPGRRDRGRADISRVFSPESCRDQEIFRVDSVVRIAQIVEIEFEMLSDDLPLAFAQVTDVLVLLRAL